MIYGNPTRNQFKNLLISKVSDGIYLEQSNGNTLHSNKIEYSRYGMHLMFSNDNVLSENVSSSNITGTMLMESKRTTVRNNAFYANKNNVNAQGLLLYLTSETDVTGNEFISNRVGIFIEEAENNTIDSNKIMDNFMGVQFQKANGNKIVRNTFVGNVNDAQAITSSNNEVNGNYWDAASKVDVDGNGESEINFTADPYFLTLTTDVPEYQLFFQAPGLILLQNMLKSPPEQLLTDTAPLMDMTMTVEKETSSSVGLWTMSIVMILASLSLFYIREEKRMKKKLFSFMVLTGFIMIFAACGKDEVQPVAINEATDTCEICNMAVVDNQYATQIVLENGKSYVFDDVGCMYEWLG